MHKSAFLLPTGEVVDLIYGTRDQHKGIAYLNSIRSGLTDEESGSAKTFHAMKVIWAQHLATFIQLHLEFDAVVSPPSTRIDAVPFRKAIIEGSEVLDLSSNFSRSGQIKSGSEGTTLSDLVGEFQYSPMGSESRIQHLLIIDDSVASGNSIAAVLQHLRDAGLSASCKITVVAWARIEWLGHSCC